MESKSNPGITGRRMLEIVLVAVCTIAFLLTALGIFIAAVGHGSEGKRDYVEYWASGQLLARGQNPYDPNAVGKLERSVGMPTDLPPMVMGNAPPALLLTYPLGFAGAKHGQFLWMLLLTGCLVLSVHLVSNALGNRQSYVKWLGVSFAPALTCIGAGQMALFVLLGVAVFLYSYRTRPFLAGAALWLCLLKPQLFLPFGLVLAIWTIRSRRFAILAGLVTSVGVSLALIWALDPLCWHQYSNTMNVLRYDRINIPCISIVLRDLAGGVSFVQYLPAIAGCIWALVYFRRHRADWDWLEHGSPLLLVSILVPPYTWFIDQCVALPALLRGLSLVRSRNLIAGLAVLSAIIEASPYLGFALLHSKFYLWTAPAWLVWYLFARSSSASPVGGLGAANSPVLETAEV